MGIGEEVFRYLQPSSLLAIVFALALVLLIVGRRGTGIGLLIAGAAAFVALAFLPVGSSALRALESRIAHDPVDVSPDGIIVLGGYHPRSVLPNDDFNVPLNDQAERLTAGAALAKRYPNAKLILTDGGRTVAGAQLSARLVRAFGIEDKRIVVEDKALSTWENAVFTHTLVTPKPGERYVIVTSGWHMPRALATFRAAGWPEPIPYPVDFVDDGRPAWRAWNDSAAHGLRLADMAAREYLATLAYYAAGRIDTPFPGEAP